MRRSKRILLMIVLGICSISMQHLTANTPEDAIGFWKTVDEKANFTTSIMAVYRYEDKLYGRVIVSYDEKTGALLETHRNPYQRIETIPSRPLLLAVDIFWDLGREKERWRNGYVLDPRSGRRYTCDCWVKDKTLILRGRFGPFGLNSIFFPAETQDFPPGYTPPDLDHMTPNIPL